VSLNSKINENTTLNPDAGLRFVHTADLHLDSPLRSLALRDPALAQIVETATRTALVRIVDLCIDEKVDALLIAGDLYDGDQKSMHTAALLINQMRRLHTVNIPVFIIRGNHDSQAAITKRLTLPDNVHVFGTKGESVELRSKPAIIHGISFGKKHIPESLLPKFPAPDRNAINIGMLHTSLAGSSEHDVYAPCSVSELDNFGYDYWALGHIHKRGVFGSSAKIVMPGIPQGRDIGESGTGTVSLVAIDENRNIDITAQVVGPAQFELLTVELNSAMNWNQIVSWIQESIQTIRANSTADHLIVRVTLRGATRLHFKLNRDSALLQEVIREFCTQSGDIWIEKLQCETVSDSQVDTIGPAQDALPDLSGIIESTVLGSANARQSANKEIEQFVKKLPGEIKHLFGETEQEREDIIDRLMREGSQSLLQNISTQSDDPNSELTTEQTRPDKS